MAKDKAKRVAQQQPPEQVEAPKAAKKSKRAAEAKCEEDVVAAQAAAAEQRESRPSKKNKKEAEAAEAAQEPARGKKRPLEEAAEAPVGEQLPEDERREAQRQIQQLVVRLRAEGKSEGEIKAAKLDLKTQLGNLRKPGGHRDVKAREWKERMSAADKAKEEVWEDRLETRAEKLQIKHDVVVIPVVWRGRHDSLDVTKAAEDIKACLAQQGVDVWLDARRQFKPGQKFAHWEHRGVMLRVEVGPDDLTNGVCRVCRAHTPGDYKSVERKRIRLPPIGTRKLLLALKGWGLDSIQIERRKGDSDSDEDGDPGTAASKKAGGDEEADLDGNWAPRMADKAEKKAKKGLHGKK